MENYHRNSTHQFPSNMNYDDQQHHHGIQTPQDNDKHYSNDETLNHLRHNNSGISSSPPYFGSSSKNPPPQPQRATSLSSSTHRRNSMSSYDTSASTATTATATPQAQRTPGQNSSNASTTPSTNKAYKGLRHFSLMVCKKVEEKGTTSYNEVADELVRQILDDRNNANNISATAAVKTFDTRAVDEKTTNALSTPSPTTKTAASKFDEKNIRRRVYDALNVLMAMNIIIKDKKAIMWRGLPTSIESATTAIIIAPSPSQFSSGAAPSQQETPSRDVLPGKNDDRAMIDQTPSSLSLEMIQVDIEKRTKSIKKKREMLQEILLQHICFRNLVERNYQNDVNESDQGSKSKSTNQTTSTDTNTPIDAKETVSSLSKNNNTEEATKLDTPDDGFEPSLLSSQSSSLSGTKRKTPSPTNSTPLHETNQVSKDTSTNNESDHTKKPSSSIATNSKKQKMDADSKKQLLLKNHKIPLPFIVINTNKNAVIQCNMSRDLTDVMFDFTMPFEINDDNSTLKRLEMHRTSHEVLRAMLPGNLYEYCIKHQLFNHLALSDSPITVQDEGTSNTGEKVKELAQ